MAESDAPLQTIPALEGLWPTDWRAAEKQLATRTPGIEADEAIDVLPDEALMMGPAGEAVPTLLHALDLAQGPLTIRAVALALATCASGADGATVDKLVAAYRAASTDVFLGPALLESLGLLALSGGLARAAAVTELLRLDRTAERYLLVKAAKVAGHLDAVRPEPDLRDRLHDWSQADDLAVQGEAR